MKFLMYLCTLSIIVSCATTAQDDYNKGVTYAYTNRESEAIPLLTKACDGKIAKACHLRGILDNNLDVSLTYYQKGCGLEDKESCEAVKVTFEKLCEKGAGVACYHRSTYEITNEVINLEEAKIYLNKACDLNEAFSCYRLAELFLKSDVKKAAPYYVKACSKGIQPACRRIKGVASQNSESDTLEAYCQAGLLGRDCKLSQK